MYWIGVFIAIYIISLLINKKEDKKPDSRKNLKEKWKKDNLDDAIEVINTEDIDQIIAFLEVEAEIAVSEGKDTRSLAGMGTVIFGPIALLAEGVKELINGSKWRGQGGKARIDSYIKDLKEYKKIKLKGIKKASDEKGKLKFSRGRLENKIPKLINYRKEELDALNEEGIVSDEKRIEELNRLKEIEGYLSSEINYINSVIMEREEMDQKVKQYHDKKDKINKAYERGYMSEEDYQSKLQEIKKDFNN
ncbi:hypothetical protein Halha_0423 [Halobacteroides halobius DSM 5150]|uniref:Uncharacterized protein n=1 Tax=Halobacteroides halobius (strain ATCC 35273 / DSM 5150 / MD-1) TaxID=748449 RepID=L0K578_HALHC|nr:hypothetical protein [Halobacteroides halobius]AGB40417.1 hypothetical protein Halha_0423 [Halobacteroides halobius DSM 5150]